VTGLLPSAGLLPLGVILTAVGMAGENWKHAPQAVAAGVTVLTVLSTETLTALFMSGGG
jgi:hypothetical protein